MPGTFEIDLRFQSDDTSADRFEDFLDSVMDEFVNLEVESDYVAVASELTATWAIDVPDASEDSLIKALTALRTALHAAGCGTAAWPSKHEVVATRSMELA